MSFSDHGDFLVSQSWCGFFNKVRWRRFYT